MSGSHRVEPLPEVAARVDSSMLRIARRLDWLRMVTPCDSDTAWQAFRKARYASDPVFHYPEPPVDIGQARKELLGLPIREIESPVYKALLAEKQHELDRQLELVGLRGSEGFLQVSIDLFGVADAELYAEARRILEAVRPDDPPPGDFIGAGPVVEAARKQMAFYRRQCPDFAAAVIRSRHIVAGLMVTEGDLLVSEKVCIPRDRLDALLHHEIGTHVLTHYNGSRQALKQLGSGLAHYSELQEGLGVLSEYLAGNLSATRLRTLAARVVAVRLLTDGATFRDVFEAMRGDCELDDQAAFTVSTRVFRGGGLTKDVVYLRGLRDLLAYLREGQPFEPLFLGKFALTQLPALRELGGKGQLSPPKLLPSYVHNAAAQRRLSDCTRLSVDHLYQRLVA